MSQGMSHTSYGFLYPRHIYGGIIKSLHDAIDIVTLLNSRIAEF